MDNYSITQLIKTLGDRINDQDDNSYDNTMIQFFESPHEPLPLKALMQAYVGGSNISSSPSDTTTFTATMSSAVSNPTNFTWGGYDGNGVYHDSGGWYWGYGGVYE